MNHKLNRRTLTLTAGAVAGIALANRILPTAAQEGTPAADQGNSSDENAGSITGTVTDIESGEPLADVYVAVGLTSVQRVGISDEEGRYAVDNVPAGEEVDVLGFREGNYRYHNSRYDADTLFTLEPGETVAYDFALISLPAEGQPEVSDPAIDPRQAAPGEEVTFAVTARGGAGGLSSEVLAASPELGRMVLMEQGENDRWSVGWTIPADAEGGEYEFAFVAASNECFDNAEFPRVTLTIAGQDDPQEATPEAGDDEDGGDGDGAAADEVTVEMVDIDFNPNEFSIPADTDVTVTLPNHGQTIHNFNIDGKNNPSDPGIASGDVQPGAETTVTVNLPAGDWYYYCSIPGHEAAGMHGIAHVE